MLLVFIRKPETVQTVKLTLHHRPKPRSASYVQLFVHRMNQTAHISLQIPSISNSVETKSTGSAAIFLAQPASVISVFVAFCPSGASLRRSVWRSVVRLSAAGEGVFTVRAGGPQEVFSSSRHLFFKNLDVRLFSMRYPCSFFANMWVPPGGVRSRFREKTPDIGLSTGLSPRGRRIPRESSLGSPDSAGWNRPIQPESPGDSRNRASRPESKTPAECAGGLGDSVMSAAASLQPVGQPEGQ